MLAYLMPVVAEGLQKHESHQVKDHWAKQSLQAEVLDQPGMLLKRQHEM